MATAAWAGVIFFFSSMPATDIPAVMPDYIPHFTEYAILTALLWMAIASTKKQKPAGLIGLWAFCLTAFYAASDEFHQSFVPGRTPDIRDWAVDVTAAVVITALLSLVKARRSRR